MPSPPPGRDADARARLFARLPACRALPESAAYELLKDFPVAPPALHLACGDGQLGLALSRGRFTFAAGADPDPAAARDAYRTGLYGRVTAGPLDRLPHPDGSFRTVLLAAPLLFGAPPDAVCREAARLLAPDGLFVAALPLAGARGVRRRLRAAALAAAGYEPTPAGDAGAWIAGLESAGLPISRRGGDGGRAGGWLAALLSLNLGKARLYARILGRPLPFPGLHRRTVAPAAAALERLARALGAGGTEHVLLVARRPS